MVGIEGVWKGILYIEEIRPYIRDEEFSIKIQSVDPDGIVTAYVTEEIHPAGLGQKENAETVDYTLLTYKVSGSLDRSESRIRLKGGKPLPGQAKTQDVYLECFYDSKKRKMNGTYAYSEEDGSLSIKKARFFLELFDRQAPNKRTF